MADRPAKRQRREHLKNLRKLRKGKREKKTQAHTAAVAETSDNLLVTLGLIICSAVLLLFIISAILQYSDTLPAVAEKKDLGVIPPVDPATIEVRVLNGCGVAGVSRRMTDRLRDLRFDVVAAENAENFDYLNTLVIDHTDRPEIGRSVAQALGCSRLSVEPDDMALAHVTVILGGDWESFLAENQSAEPEPGKIRKVIGKARKILGMD